jgi:hypothetical protein
MFDGRRENQGPHPPCDARSYLVQPTLPFVPPAGDGWPSPGLAGAFTLMKARGPCQGLW